ncbi:MAG: glyoxalase superfamily protein [Xanthomonadaceae bacterium]|nr:glyoxalase superfamily protein [Xanthomonadaceae bacterium]
MLFPVFAVRDMGAALDFYQDRLGFAVAWTWGTPVVRAGVALDEIEIQLDCAGGSAPDGPSVVYCHMMDVRAYHAACSARGVVFALDLGERPWGMIDFRVVDPDGNRIGFASPAASDEQEALAPSG